MLTVETIGRIRRGHFGGKPMPRHTSICVGNFYGARTKRFGSLLKRSPHTKDVGMHPVILDIAQRVLGPFHDQIQLNFTQALEIQPGAPAQYPHRDQGMWRGGKRPYSSPLGTGPREVALCKVELRNAVFSASTRGHPFTAFFGKLFFGKLLARFGKAAYTFVREEHDFVVSFFEGKTDGFETN
jgi:hypothetical protein